jgi:O-antigen ligase
MLALLFAAVLVGVRLWNEGLPRTFSWTPLHAVLAAFVAYIGLSAWLAGSPLELGFAKNLLLYALLVLSVTDEPELTAILWAGVLAGIVQSGLGLAQIASEGGIPPEGTTALLPNHVQYGLYLLLASTFSIALAARTRGLVRALVIAAGVVALAMSVASLARGVVLVAAVCALLWLALYVKRRWVVMGGVAGVLLAGGLAWYFVSRRLEEMGVTRPDLTVEQRISTLFSGRLPLLVAAWRMFLEHPFVGAGYGRYKQLWSRYAPEEYVVSEAFGVRELAAHSTHLQVMAELGVVGIVGYVAIEVLGLRASLGAITRAREIGRRFLAQAGIAVFLGVAAFAFHGLIDNTGWHDRLFYVFLALASAVEGMSLVAQDGTPADEPLPA